MNQSYVPILELYVPKTIEIINNTRGGIVIVFIENKRERVFFLGGGANSSPGRRARRLLAELMLP